MIPIRFKEKEDFRLVPTPCVPSCRQEHWSMLLFPPPGDLPDPGNEPASPVAPALSGRLFFITSATWEIHTS